MDEIRHDWSMEEIAEIYEMPLMALMQRAAELHRQYHTVGEVQVCSLLSVKTGGCAEDCSYCSQSAHSKTAVKAEPLMKVDQVIEAAHRAKDAGSTRFCMGAAWRGVKDNKDFDEVLEMVSRVNEMEMEVCATLGMITLSQAQRLKEAGLTSYNHNLDTGPDFYKEVIRTRSYQDRLDTMDKVAKAELSLCSGGIIGLGESHEDRMAMLYTLSTLKTHPESIPVNALVPVKGTPLEDRPHVDIWEMIRMISTARILVPTAKVRLSAGRENMSEVEQALCFMAGANSIFAGEKLLTAPNAGDDRDKGMFELLGLTAMPSFKFHKEAVAG